MCDKNDSDELVFSRLLIKNECSKLLAFMADIFTRMYVLAGTPSMTVVLRSDMRMDGLHSVLK